MEIYYNTSDGKLLPTVEEEEPVELDRSDFEHMGSDEEADSIEEAYERWQAAGSEFADDFARPRFCTECKQSYDSVEEARDDHTAPVTDKFRDKLSINGGHELIGYPRSLSVRDVIETEEGLFVCDTIGFTEATWK